MTVLVPLFIVFVVAAIAYALWWEAQRRKKLREWAERHGLRFRRHKDRRMDTRFPAFACLQHGRSRYACNILDGEWAGRPFLGFDYHYVTGSGKSRRAHWLSAVVLQSPILLERLSIRREHLFDKVSEFFGVDDIDFESAEFSRRFHVSAKDKRWAYDVIHARMMEFLMQAPEFPLEFAGRHVIAWRDRLLDPKDFEAAAELISGVLDRLPDYLVEQQTNRN